MNDFLAGLVSGVVCAIAILILATFEFEKARSDAIERGYALYCPQDGKFAWVGECEE